MRAIVSVLLFIVVQYVRSDPCLTNFGGCDRQNGLCWGTGRRTHFCTCKAGYTELILGNFRLCADVNECETDPALCPKDATCVNTPGSYTCTCKCGFVKDYTGQRCLDASKITGLCNPDTNCKGSPASSRLAFSIEDLFDFRRPIQRPTTPPMSRTCRGCEEGFKLNSCGYCEDIDECDHRNPCSGPNTVCVNTEGSYYCDCRSGYTLGPCGRRCYRSTERIPLICSTNDLQRLRLQGMSLRTFNRPINLLNWRNCATGVTPGQTTTERYDTNNDNVVDLILRWECTRRRRQDVSVLKSAAERAAHWDHWTCWTACKPTCWGGLQTRMRVCVNGLPGTEGCMGEGSQKKECYSGPKCKYRIRKDASTLSRSEEEDLLQAMELYKKDTSARGFFNAAAAHGWPGQCGNRESCCPHGAKLKFLSWHRTILLNYEEGLNRYMKDKNLGIPYWNWLRNDRNPPKLGWQKTLYGRENPFSNMTVLIDRSGPMRTIQREDTIFTFALDFAHGTWLNVTKKLIKPYTWHEFSESLESAHGGPHVSVCGMGGQSAACRISLAVLEFAGFDPLFMFHHSQVDRLWAVAQYNLERARQTTWTPQAALEALEPRGDFGRRQMPFGNLTLNPFPIVWAVNNMRDAYYYEELTGIKYDSLKHDGFPRPLVGGRFLRKGGQEQLHIAHYLQSVESTVYVNYYVLLGEEAVPCSNLTEDVRVGSTQIQGTMRPYRNSVPRLTVMEKVGFSNLDDDYVVQACYTASPTCRSECPELRTPRINAMPDPAIVHYLPNQPIDVFKFTWSAGRRLPTWYIDIDAKSHWLFFFGDRVSEIRQVPTGRDWISCRNTNARPFPCHLPSGACLLPSGIYYLIDNSLSHCQRGLKMLIVARQS